MSAARDNRMPLLPVLAAGGARGDKLADVICALVVQGGKLGELQAASVLDEGTPREILVPPLIWFDRLMLAVERGAIEAMSAQAITQIILRPKQPAAQPINADEAT